jgi:hypothetical protein
VLIVEYAVIVILKLIYSLQCSIMVPKDWSVLQNIVRACYKLTDAHLILLAQNAMKVSLAAQVMSHTVGATLNAVASQGKEHCSVYIVL